MLRGEGGRVGAGGRLDHRGRVVARGDGRRLDEFGEFEHPERGGVGSRTVVAVEARESHLVACLRDAVREADGDRRCTRSRLTCDDDHWHVTVRSKRLVPRGRVELPTPRFSVVCSTN